MTVSSLSTHKATIYRITETRTSDVGDPTVTLVAVATNVPCRLDRDIGRSITNVIREIKIDARLFVSADVITQALSEKDVIDVVGESGRFAIETIDRVFASVALHHYEISLVRYTGALV